MEKPELSIGKLVEVKGGKRYIIRKTTAGARAVAIDSWTYIGDIREEITQIWDVPYNPSHAADYSGEGRELEWQLEIKEMTVAEVSKALGYEVKIIQ